MLRFGRTAFAIGLVIFTLAACEKSPSSPTVVVPGPTVVQPGPVPETPIDPRRPGGTRGTIENFSGVAGAFQFNLGSQLIKGDATTQILDRNGQAVGVSALGNGLSVAVSGWLLPDDLFATTISIE